MQPSYGGFLGQMINKDFLLGWIFIVSVFQVWLKWVSFLSLKLWKANVFSFVAFFSRCIFLYLVPKPLITRAP